MVSVETIKSCLEDRSTDRLIPLAAPLGSGKTTACIQYCLEHSYSFCLVVPNISNILDIISRFPEVTPFYGREKKWSKYMVTTYAMFQHIIDRLEHDYIIFDEFHIVISDRTFRKFIRNFDSKIQQMTNNKIILSATPDILAISRHPLWRDPCILAKRSDIRLKHVDVYVADSLRSAVSMARVGHYDVIYCDNSLMYFDYAFVDAGYKHVYRGNLSSMWNEIFDDSHCLRERIFTTKCINTGVNIMNREDMNVAIICYGMLNLDLIQFLGRFRKANVNVDIFFVSESPNTISATRNDDIGKAIDAILECECSSLEDFNILHDYFRVDKLVVHDKTIKYEFPVNSVRNFIYEHHVVPTHKYDSEFMLVKQRIRNVGYHFYVYKRDLDRLPECVYLDDYPQFTPRSLKSLLTKLGLQIVPVKKNRKIIGYKIIK